MVRSPQRPVTHPPSPGQQGADVADRLGGLEAPEGCVHLGNLDALVRLSRDDQEESRGRRGSNESVVHVDR